MRVTVSPLRLSLIRNRLEREIVLEIRMSFVGFEVTVMTIAFCIYIFLLSSSYYHFPLYVFLEDYLLLKNKGL